MDNAFRLLKVIMIHLARWRLIDHLHGQEAAEVQYKTCVSTLRCYAVFCCIGGRIVA